MVRFLPVLVVAVSSLVSATRFANAAEHAFPYQATVVGQKVEVRCGPGSNFYVTGYLQQDQQATVHRHDHGGWYMIAPPPGSISWIDASLVQRTDAERGVINIPPGSGARAIVHMGSEVSDEHSFYGRELSHGDQVTILGEKTFSSPRGDIQMVKITPPAQEFRWVKGEFLVPRNQQVQQQLAVDPYQVPPAHRRRFIAEGRQLTYHSLQPKQQEEASSPAPTPEQIAQEESAQKAYDRLDELDRRYQEIVAKPPRDWNLDEVSRGYEKLKAESTGAITLLIDQRLTVVKKRLEISSHYKNFLQVAAETSERDAQLLAQQAAFEAPAVAGDQFQAGTFPVEGVPTEAIPAPMPLTVPSNASPVVEAPQLDGAGIVQRDTSRPDSKLFVLVSPDGRLLAYLEPGEEVSLKDWVGKPAGLAGSRAFDPQLGADRIQVRKVTSVQLVR